jgi:hypothetical protein
VHHISTVTFFFISYSTLYKSTKDILVFSNVISLHLLKYEFEVLIIRSLETDWRKNMGPTTGIELGTTHSCVAKWNRDTNRADITIKKIDSNYPFEVVR